MKSKLGICLVVVVAVGIIAWWGYPVAITNEPPAAIEQVAEPVTFDTDVTREVSEQQSPLSLPEQLEQAKQASIDCWDELRQNLPEKPSLFDNQLTTALKNALARGESYEQLLLRTPAGDMANNYLRQLNIAQRQLQLQQMGIEPSEAQLEERQQEKFFAQLSANEQRIMLAEEIAGQQFTALKEQLSPLMALDTQQFVAQTRGYTLTSGDLTSLMLQDRRIFPEEKLLALIEQTPTSVLSEPPLVVNMLTTTPFINMADYAAFALDIPLLKALAARGIHPTDIKGVVGPLEYVLSHRRWGEDDSDKTIETLKYLVGQGYKAYTVNSANGPQLGSPIFQERWRFISDEVKQYLQSANALTPSVALLSSPSGDIDRALTEIASIRRQRAERHQKCRTLQENESQVEQLLTGPQIHSKIEALAEQYSGDALLDALQAEDPALVDIYLDQRSNARPSHYREIRAAMLKPDPVTELGELLQTTDLTEGDIDVMWMQLPRFPELVPYWNNRQTPLPPSTLRLFVDISADGLKELLAQGFDLHVVDKYHRSLYGVFFATEPQLIEQLLQARVDPFSNDYGADALDMAFDRSYRDNELFANTAEILQAVSVLAPHHQRRLARLKIYRPQLYQQLLAIDANIAVNDHIQPNSVLSVR